MNISEILATATPPKQSGLTFQERETLKVLAMPASDQFRHFIGRIKPVDTDHMLRIVAFPGKGIPDEWWLSDRKRRKYNWNEERSKPRSFQWWLDWNGDSPALCNAKGDVKRTGWAEIHKFLRIYSRNGYGIYIQPNPCLLGDSSQASALPGRCIFIESDGTIPTSNQESQKITTGLAQQAQALAPDLVVTTFKSAHTYRIQEHVYSSIGAWQVDQARFTQSAREIWGNETDESLIDTNQLMRLPGFSHTRWQDGRMQTVPVRIAFDSGKAHADIQKDLPALEAPVISKALGEAHEFSGWELGSFAHLLDGFKANARQNKNQTFHTCKCPAHGGQSDNSLHINADTSQFICHAGCESKAVYQAALKVAIARGYQLPERSQEKLHWDYEEPGLGIWGQVAAQHTDGIQFDEQPDLMALLPKKLMTRILGAKSVSSPQAIALKAYSEFLGRNGNPEYVEDAKELIGGAWDWDGIPDRVPLWGWSDYIKKVKAFCLAESRAELNKVRDSVKAEAKSKKVAEARKAADAWEMLPEEVEWLGQRYFGDEILNRVLDAEAERSIMGVVGPTGTGKTTALKKVSDYANQRNKQFVYLTVKETLGRATAIDLGIPYRLDLADSTNPYPSFAGCMASLIDGARGVNWQTQISDKAIVVIDEADLALSIVGGVGSSSASLEMQQVLSHVLRTAQTVILMSAQLKSRHINLVKAESWINNVQSVGILNSAVPRSITICDGSQGADTEATLETGEDSQTQRESFNKYLVSLLIQKAIAGEKSLVMSGSQKPDSRLGTMLLESYLKEALGITSVLRLDSQSTRDPVNPAFKIAERDYVSIFRKYQIALCSPSAQEGFNLDFGNEAHFQNVFIFDPGSKRPEQTIQDIGRDRHDGSVHVSVAPGHTSKLYGGTVDPQEILRQLQAAAAQPESKLLGTAIQQSARNWGSNYLHFYCEDVAQSNAAISDKAYNLERYLTYVGHQVATLKSVPGEKTKSKGPDPFDEFYEYRSNQFHEDVAVAEFIDRFEAEELQQSGENTLAQWYSLQQLQCRQALRLDIHRQVDVLTLAASIEEAEHSRTVPSILDAGLVRQWSRGRVAKPWLLDYYSRHSTWDAFAHDVSKRQFKPAYEKLGENGEMLAEFTPEDLLSPKARKLSVLKQLGILDFLEKFRIDVASDAIVSSTNTKQLAATLHQQHQEKRFTKEDLKPIVEKLSVNFEETCELLGVRSQRNDKGEIDHRQVLTIIRNVFSIKTFRIGDASLGGVRGVYVLVADDKAQALRKGLLKAEKYAGDADSCIWYEEAIQSAQDTYHSSHRRIELHPIWDTHLEVERATFRQGISERVTEINSLRPAHWECLLEYFAARSEEQAEQRAEALRVEAEQAKAEEKTTPQSTPLPHSVCDSIPVPTPGKNWEWTAFESALIEAKSLAELQAAKKSFPENLRRNVMRQWQADGRYQWLEAKAQQLDKDRAQV